MSFLRTYNNINLSIEGVYERVSCSVGHTAAAMRLSSSAKVEPLAAKRPLVDLAVFCTTKWHPIVLQLMSGGEGKLISAHL